MARLSRGAFRSSRGSSKRLTEWGLGPGATAPVPISTTVATILGSFAVPVIPGMTVVRLRGYFRMHLTLATSAGDGFGGAFGVGIATLAAVTAGGASVPTPITEADADNWLFHRFVDVAAGFPFASAADPAGNRHAFIEFEVDSKAMRKLPLEMAIYSSLEVTEVGTAGAQVWFDSRMLLKLS